MDYRKTNLFYKANKNDWFQLKYAVSFHPTRLNAKQIFHIVHIDHIKNTLKIKLFDDGKLLTVHSDLLKHVDAILPVRSIYFQLHA